jgi:hypothetical protein
MDNLDEIPEPRELQKVVPRKVYEKPVVMSSHRVFEVSLACIKVPASAMCHLNVARTRS